MVFKKGHKHSEETKKKIGLGNTGKIISVRTKHLLSINRFGENNPNFGNHLSEDSKEKLRKERLNEKNAMWKGDQVQMEALHSWVHRRKPKPNYCEKCKKQKPYDLANISGEYKRDVNDFEWLCRRCHLISDNRLFNNLKNVANKKMEIIKTI